MRIIFSLTLSLFFIQKLSAQYHGSGTAVTSAMANATTALNGESSALFNPAGLYSVNKTFLYSGVQTLYQLPEFTRYSMGFMHPFKEIKAGMRCSVMGDGKYSDLYAGIFVAHRKEKVSLAAGIDYCQEYVKEYYVRRTLTAGLYGQIIFSEKVTIGAKAENITASWRGRGITPLILSSGVVYRVTETLSVFGDVKKEILYPEKYSIAFQYQYKKYFFIRSGIQLNPLQLNGGFGWNTPKISIDYAVQHHEQLGFSHQLGILLRWKNK